MVGERPRLLGDEAGLAVLRDAARRQAERQKQRGDEADDGLRPRAHGGVRGEADHEAGAGLAVGTVLDPHLAAVQAHVLGDEGQAEADPVAAAAAPAGPARAAGEAVEDEVAVLGRDPGPGVLDRDLDAAVRCGRRSRRSRRRRTSRRCPAGWRSPARGGACRRGPPARRGRAPPRSGTSRSVDASTAWCTSSTGLTSSSERRATPASKREISSRSSTSCWKRAMSAAMRSTAACADSSGISSRRVASTSIDAARVMSGERSSWLTSDAKRPSRSIRSSSAWAMWLNDVTSASRSGSSPPSSRVSSRPPAMASAATPDVRQGAQGAAADPVAERGAGERRHERGAEQRHGQRLERALQLVERDDLVVRDVLLGQRDADGELGARRRGRSASGPRWPPPTTSLQRRSGGRPGRTPTWRPTRPCRRRPRSGPGERRS